jgi:predicted regulator of Ras-like GTPase activity (Roadblock/LC7/MglB family)
MDTSPQQVALEQLAAVPGVIGSLIFDGSGKVQASAFPAATDAWALAQLAAQLAADGYFQEWMAGEQGLLTLRFVDGQVALRSLGGAFALVYAGAQANEQLLSMSLAQLARRLGTRPAPPARPAPAAAAPAAIASAIDAPPVLARTPAPAAAPVPAPAPRSAVPAPLPSPGPIQRLEELARQELGEHAEQAVRILAAAGPRTKDQLRAVSEVEKLVRFFISKKKAEELARKMRAVLEE